MITFKLFAILGWVLIGLFERVETFQAPNRKSDETGAHWSLIVNGHRMDEVMQRFMALIPSFRLHGFEL